MTGAVLVTGAAGGLGLAIARRLIDDGRQVVIADIDAAAVERAAAGIGAQACVLDIADEAAVVETVGAIARDRGLWGLVNNAGVHKNVSVVASTAQDWDRIHSINARGTFLMCREGARHMVRARQGRIVNIVTRVNFGNPFSAAYMASKSAIYALTQCLAVEVARAGVRVNGVGPGHVGPGTGMARHFKAKADSLGMAWEDFEAQVHKTIPLGRWCTPDDVGGAVSFLMGPDADFITGEFIYVTGGFQAYGVAPDPEQLENPYG
ncbi:MULTISPECIES: SDR family NAD(P)-dependent oxidoreductase [unclassified Roseitalea]|uniref:SDR family NAD(P)-dependent oxidoreductase n=1 Tax=unclassified Roseitalea TaxID=2639107 RepID=UPI00273DC6AB|nr:MULTISPECIES: SDR family NAD(P)-dependent oxidoreductase [unclassified Roseitalea]